MKKLTVLRNTRKRLEARSVKVGDCIEFRAPINLGYVTPQENVARSMKHRTYIKAVQESDYCPQGHIKAYNLTKSGQCKTCKNIYSKAYRERRKREIQ